MVINHNIAALNTFNQLSKNEKAQSSSLSKLSSGLRINNAADDAAGLAISQKMTAQVNGLNTASSNAQNGISLIQTAEGGMNEVQSIMQRMNELAVQSANDTNDGNGGTDRSALNNEFSALKGEIDRIAGSTQFNGKNLLNNSVNASIDQATANSTILADGSVNTVSQSGLAVGTWTLHEQVDHSYILSNGAGTDLSSNVAAAGAGTINFGGANGQTVSIQVNDSYAQDDLDGLAIDIDGGGSLTLQIGANAGDTINIAVGDMRVTGGTNASITALGAADISTQAGASTAITTLQTAIDAVSTQRANLGAYQNRLDHTINNLSTESQNLTAASAAITDVDMAKEMMSYTKSNILNQAAQAMLAQANQLPQGALQLLK